MDLAALEEAHRHATRYLQGLADRPVARPWSPVEIEARLGGPMPEAGQAPVDVVRALASAVEPALIASSGPRYFGFVIGGTLPAALAADWLTSAWDQNAGIHAASPAAALVETIVVRWLLELLGLPATAGVGLVTGCQMASFTGLAAARDEVLLRSGWNVPLAGLSGAPPIRVLVGADAHLTIHTALRMLGLGSRQVETVPVDGQGRILPGELRQRLEATSPGPTIVCAQVGNVNTGAVDPMAEIVAAARAHGAWVHVDGAFGLWAACDPDRRALLDGVELADSWATDGHKWLNVPYDCGIAIVRDAAAHRRALAKGTAAYLIPAADAHRDAMDWTPDASRRARAFPVYAALRSLGRQGVAALVQGCCGLARRMAERLARTPGFRILNEVVLNQVLIELNPVTDAAAATAQVLDRLQREGTCWAGPTVWQGRPAIRISVSSWATTAEDIDRAADALIRAAS